MAHPESPEYEWILCEAPSQADPFGPFVNLGVLNGAKGRQFEIIRNRAGSASFTLSLSDPMAYEILDKVDDLVSDVRGTIRKCIRIRRNGVDIWSGPVWGLSGSLPDGTLQVSCVGWLETLQKRFWWGPAALDYSNEGAGIRTDLIIADMLQKINAQDLAHPLLVKMGLVYGKKGINDFNQIWPRNRNWEAPVQLYPKIQELSDVEAGVDYMVDPLTRELNLYAWDAYTTHENLWLGYNYGPNNIAKLSWQESSDRMCNVMRVGNGGSPGSSAWVDGTDSSSMDEFGRFEELVTLTGANPGVLGPYGAAEMVVRSRPLVTYNLTPFPVSRKRQVPRLFEDYQIGDKIYFSAQHESFKVIGQAIKIFGASISVDENGTEIVNNLMTAPPGGSSGLTT